MDKKNNLPKKLSIFGKIRNKVKYLLGYREPEKFMIDTKPDSKKYSPIEQNHIANIEKKLKEILDENSKQEKMARGISEKEAIEILEWTVQNARDGLVKAGKISNIFEADLMGLCGVGQSITTITLQNMGLSPKPLNIGDIVGNEAGRHAFTTVNIPIRLEDGTVIDKSYLLDTTFRQFYLISEYTNRYGDYIQDKRYGGKVPSTAGYWMLIQGRKGRELSEEILSKGFFELTEEKAKIFFDSIYLSCLKRKKPTRVPKRSELRTRISGAEYIKRTKDPNNEEELDCTAGELNALKINTTTPLMEQENIENVTKLVIEMNKDNEGPINATSQQIQNQHMEEM